MKNTLFGFLLIAMFGFFLQSNIYGQGTWTVGSSSGLTDRAGLTCSVIGDKIYAIGGITGSLTSPTYLNTIEIFDPIYNSWSTPATTGTFAARFAHSATVLNDKIYVIGGYNQSGNLNGVSVFDPAANTWTTLTTTGVFAARNGHCASAIDGKIYVIGGNNQTNLKGVAVFDPVANSWTLLNPTGTFTPRFGLVSEVVDGKIYTFGGSDGKKFFNTVEVYDPNANSWSTPVTTGTFTPRESPGIASVGGKIYVMGGDTNFTVNNFTNIVEAFDPVTNTWATPQTTGTFTTRVGLACSEYGGKIYAIGGLNGLTLSVNEVFTPSSSAVTSSGELSELRLFPNPTSGALNIQLPIANEVNVTVMNLLGVAVMEVKNLPGSDFTLDLSKLVPGSYYIRISSAKSVVTKMVVKE